MQCQTHNCNQTAARTRTEHMSLDDETCTIKTNLCKYHAVLVAHGDWTNWNVTKI